MHDLHVSPVFIKQVLPVGYENAITPKKCTLVGTAYADVVQLILGLLSFSVLFIKYACEKPRRDCRTWSMDTSKQAFGGILLHFVNIWVSNFFETNMGNTDACGLYLLVFLLDSSLGTFFNYACLKLLHKFAGKRHAMWHTPRWESVAVSGDYGKPARCDWFLKQMAAWLTIITCVKAALIASLYVFRSEFAWMGRIILSPLQATPKIELIVVMVGCPLVLNSVVFWATDVFLKKPAFNTGRGGKGCCSRYCCCCCHRSHSAGLDEKTPVAGAYDHHDHINPQHDHYNRNSAAENADDDYFIAGGTLSRKYGS